MRRFLAPVFLCCALLASAAAFAYPGVPAPQLAAKAWLLIDNATGQVLAGQDVETRVEPASLTKLMTAYLSFTAIRQGVLKEDQAISVSETAWKADGSKMFIEPKKPVTVAELLRGMIIQSGNDACIALAEAIAGSEAKFVEMMNREAQRLGMSNTSFANATGLTHPQHYTTVRDLAVLTSALIRDFPDFYPIYSQKEFTYNKITQPNRNRLLWLDPSVDGVKTGHTDAAGYCLISSSKRGVRRLIAVVVGTTSDNARAQESLKLLNYGYQAYDAVKLYAKDQSLSDLRVYKGSSSKVKAGFVDDFVLSMPKGSAGRVKVDLISQQPLLAPLQRGQRVATLRVSVDEQTLGDYPVVALEDVGVAGFFGRLWDAILLFFK